MNIETMYMSEASVMNFGGSVSVIPAHIRIYAGAPEENHTMLVFVEKNRVIFTHIGKSEFIMTIPCNSMIHGQRLATEYIRSGLVKVAPDVTETAPDVTETVEYKPVSIFHESGKDQYVLYWTNSKGTNYKRFEWYAGANGVSDHIRKIARQKTTSMIVVLGVEDRMGYNVRGEETGVREHATLLEGCVMDRKTQQMTAITSQNMPVYGIPGIRYDTVQGDLEKTSRQFASWINCIR